MLKAERDALKLELRARKLVEKKLKSAMNSLLKQVQKIKEDRVARKEQLSEYKSETDLQDAYGWGFITEEEYDALLEKFRTGTEASDNETSPAEVALDIIRGWYRITTSDIAALEFDLLPPKKQQEIRERNEEILKQREERRKERENHENQARTERL